MNNGVIKVILADDHDLIRQGLKRIISFEKGIRVVGEADNGKMVFSEIKKSNPDVLLLDMKMPIMDGLEVLRKVKEDSYDIQIIILTVENDIRTIRDAINIGADGYLLKDSAGTEVVDAIYSVNGGNKYIDKSLVSLLFMDINGDFENKDSLLDGLTKREIDVLYYISKGYSNKEIGQVLFLSEKTIKNYASKLFKKMKVNDRVQATILAIEHNVDEYYSNRCTEC